MTRKTSAIPKAPVARILMNAGAKRVSAEAAETFSEILYDIAIEIAERAVQISRHSGRKTVHESDIRLAFKQ